jgi:hypothetical protein
MARDEPMNALRRATAERLRAATGPRDAIVAAIEQFLDEAESIVDEGKLRVYSPSALWDHFAISSPSIPEMAGYDTQGRDRIVRIFSTVAHKRWGDGRPLPPDWPWHEQESADANALADGPGE